MNKDVILCSLLYIERLLDEKEGDFYIILTEIDFLREYIKEG
jgi:hypothetical protein